VRASAVHFDRAVRNRIAHMLLVPFFINSERGVFFLLMFTVSDPVDRLNTGRRTKSEMT
jgi:hypothetical protein